jgi:hypothetical protein
MSQLRCGDFLLALIVAYGMFGPAPLVEPVMGAQRLRPPESLQCPRNHLTAFQGRVLSFRRGLDQTVIRLRTDEATTEQLILHYPEGSDLTQWFLLRGKPFQPDDWALIESDKHRLRAKMRAIVWVCDDGTNPVIDWQPFDNRQQPRPR